MLSFTLIRSFLFPIFSGHDRILLTVVNGSASAAMSDGERDSPAPNRLKQYDVFYYMVHSNDRRLLVFVFCSFICFNELISEYKQTMYK